jgi:hypothetical protein
MMVSFFKNVMPISPTLHFLKAHHHITLYKLLTITQKITQVLMCRIMPKNRGNPKIRPSHVVAKGGM